VCVCVCVCNAMYIMSIRVHVYVCGVYVHGVYVYGCKGLSSYVWMHVAVISDTFVRSRPVTGDFGVTLVMDPIHRRFKNRPMGCSGDSYRFVQ